MKKNDFDVILVGAGAAGLACATTLKAGGAKIKILEAADRAGGRIRTDELKGFRLDRGFQVLLTAYPECRRLLDYESLQLGQFDPGALVWSGKELIEMMDPIRRPTRLGQALMNPVGGFRDKFKVGRLKAKLALTSIDRINTQPERPTHDRLQELGFSRKFVQGFMRPFLAGIFLEENLETTSRMFEFVFKMFGEGFAALPAGGMQAIPDQLAERLGDEILSVKTPVVDMDSKSVTTAKKEKLTAEAVVLATDMDNAANLAKSSLQRPWNPTSCLYFSAPESLIKPNTIILNGSSAGHISNVSIPSDIAKSYAPEGLSLICVSMRPGSQANPESVRQELAEWFGLKAQPLEFLRQYEIPHALPRQLPGDNALGGNPLKLDNGIWVAGDYRYSASIEGAMASGRAVAEQILSS